MEFSIVLRYDMFDNIYKLDGVPVATVQLRFDGWVTELSDPEKMKDVQSDYSRGRAPGLDNLLYSADAEFSCFADLALTSPSSNYYKPGEVRGNVLPRCPRVCFGHLHGIGKSHGRLIVVRFRHCESTTNGR